MRNPYVTALGVLSVFLLVLSLASVMSTEEQETVWTTPAGVLGGVCGLLWLVLKAVQHSKRSAPGDSSRK